VRRLDHDALVDVGWRPDKSLDGVVEAILGQPELVSDVPGGGVHLAGGGEHKPPHRLGSLACLQSAGEHDGVQALRFEEVRDAVDVRRPLRENQAVALTVQGSCHSQVRSTDLPVR
jgi:hypothetical protein